VVRRRRAVYRSSQAGCDYPSCASRALASAGRRCAVATECFTSALSLAARSAISMGGCFTPPFEAVQDLPERHDHQGKPVQTADAICLD